MGKKVVEEIREESVAQPRSFLSNTIITVRYILKKGHITDNKHFLYGGMAETSTKTFCLPINSLGSYHKAFTPEELEFLEDEMGLERGDLSYNKRVDNFWGKFRVKLGKSDSVIDLSDPEGYLQYKVLLANVDFICPSIQDLEDKPKSTYRYVLIKEDDLAGAEKGNLTNIMRAYKAFGRFEDDKHTLRTIIELITGKPVSERSKIEFLQGSVNKLIQSDVKRFLLTAEDEYLPMKVLIKRAVQAGLISNRGNFYYNKKDNTPLCGDNQDPTLNTAARYLSLPRNQEVRFEIEAKLNEKE